jgi:hypothetical protein
MSTISANTFLAADGTPTTEPSIPALDQRMAKAWVNFNGTGTVAILSSYNISSITDLGVGWTQASLASSLPTDRAISGLCKANGFVTLQAFPTSTTDLGAFRCLHINGSIADFDYVGLTVFSN